MRRRVRRVERVNRGRGGDRRSGFFLLFSIVAAMVLGLVLIKFGIPGIGGADRGGIKLSMLSDAKSAISAEITCYSQIGSYVEGTVYSDSDEAVKEPLEGCSNVYLVASPHNTVTVTTYTSLSGEDCFTVRVTNEKVGSYRAVYDSCFDAAPRLVVRGAGGGGGGGFIPIPLD